MNVRISSLLIAALWTGLAGPSIADPPTPDYSNMPGYQKALESSWDPQAATIRLEIAAGPMNFSKELAAAKRDGLPTDLLAFEPAIPPAQKNAALIWEKLLSHEPLRTGNHFGTYVSQFAYTPEELNDQRNALSANSSVIADIHRAADRPQCFFAGEWHFPPTGNPFGFGFPFRPSYSQFRECARTLQLESCLAARQGNYAWAIRDDARIFKMARQLRTGPKLIDTEVAQGVTAIGLDGMRAILYIAGPNVPVDHLIASTVRTQCPDIALEKAMRRDVAYVVSRDQYLRDAGPTAIARWFAADAGDDPSTIKPLPTASERRFVENLLDAEEGAYLHDMRTVIMAAARRTAYTRASLDPDTNDPTSSYMLSVVPFAEDMNRQNAALERITLTMADALIIKAKTGSYPEKLPHTCIYTDPYSGSPLDYQRQGDGFVVRSVGRFAITNRLLEVSYPIRKVPVPDDYLRVLRLLTKH